VAQYRLPYEKTFAYLSAGEHVLDWGCGNGHFSYFLTKHGVRTVGLSFEEASAALVGQPLFQHVRDAASRSITMAGSLAVEYSLGVMATIPSPSASPDAAEDLLFREQCRRQLRRPVEARMKYGFCRVSRPGLDVPAARVFASTREYREWCAANLPAYLGYQPAPPE